MTDDDFPSEMTMTLRTPLHPLGGQGDVVTELHLREPTCGELEAASKVIGGVSADIALIASITGHPAGLIRSMGAYDYARCSNFLGGFAQRGLAIGLNSAQI